MMPGELGRHRFRLCGWRGAERGEQGVEEGDGGVLTIT
jgi:hypothetical protein